MVCFHSFISAFLILPILCTCWSSPTENSSYSWTSWKPHCNYVHQGGLVWNKVTWLSVPALLGAATRPGSRCLAYTLLEESENTTQYLWNIQYPVHNKCSRHRFNQILIILATITFLFSSLLLNPILPDTPLQWQKNNKSSQIAITEFRSGWTGMSS